jgi:hypothetical protein
VPPEPLGAIGARRKQNGGVEHLVDLDALAERLTARIPEWERSATVGAMTWRDERAAWPQPIVIDRAVVEVPESLGVRLTREPEDEAEIVVWTGGWADIGLFVNGRAINPWAEFQDVDGAYAAVVDTVEDFLSRRLDPPAGF